ncbi:hypothetical protein H4I95_03299 [Botrytis cinerea]
MSSHTSHKYKKKSKEPSNSPWSEWKWDSKREQWQSYRTNSGGAIEWKYDDQLHSSSSAAAHIPRLDGASPLNTVSEDTNQYSNEQNYTTSNNNIGLVTDSLATTSLDPRPNRDPPIVANLQRNNTSTQHRNFDPITGCTALGNSDLARHDINSSRYLVVFKVLWSEPSGSTAGGGGGTVLSRREVHGQEIFAKVRRPIMSYEGRATSKSGVHPEEHAIIYTTPEPRLVDNEDGSRMIFDPVKMIPESSRHVLDEASRINYAKIYTVEYNVKVWFIGHVDRSCEQIVRRSYDDANQPLLLSSQPSDPTAYSTNNFYLCPANTAGYSSTPSYPSILGYGNQMPPSTPGYGAGYGAAPASSNMYGSSQYFTPDHAPPLYSQPQYSPQYPPQHPSSQYSTSQHQQYTNSTSQGYNYGPQGTYDPGSGAGQQ